MRKIAMAALCLALLWPYAAVADDTSNPGAPAPGAEWTDQSVPASPAPLVIAAGASRVDPRSSSRTEPGPALLPGLLRFLICLWP
jgi:hypothetical protein